MLNESIEPVLAQFFLPLIISWRRDVFDSQIYFLTISIFEQRYAIFAVKSPAGYRSGHVSELRSDRI